MARYVCVNDIVDRVMGTGMHWCLSSPSERERIADIVQACWWCGLEVTEDLIRWVDTASYNDQKRFIDYAVHYGPSEVKRLYQKGKHPDPSLRRNTFLPLHHRRCKLQEMPIQFMYLVQSELALTITRGARKGLSAGVYNVRELFAGISFVDMIYLWQLYASGSRPLFMARYRALANEGRKRYLIDGNVEFK